MGDEIFIGENIERKSSNKKIFIIVISIILILLIGREAYKFYNFYNNSEKMNEIYDDLIHNINQPKEFFLTGKEYNKTNINDSSLAYYALKSKYNRIVDSEINGRKDYVTYQMAFDITCKDGTVYKNVGISEDIKCPDYPNDFGQKTIVGVKEISPEKQIPFTTLISYSVLDILVENMIFAKMNLEESKKEYPNMAKLQANTIFTLINTALDARIGLSNMKIYRDYNSTQNSHKVASISEMQRFVTFTKEFKTPSIEEIEALNLKNACKEMYIDFTKDLVPFSINSLISKIFLIERGASQVCNEIEKIQRENLFDILKKIEKESNPFMLINYKLYVGFFVECSGDISQFNSENNEEGCFNNYFNSYEEKLHEEGFIK